MAGLGRKVFNAGEVLSAANVQGYLQDQVVQVYSGTAARSSALGTAVSEGMTSYLTDSNELSVYTVNGTAAWSPVSLVQSPNVIINGGFDIWQRGTSAVAPTSTTFVADRFKTYRDGSGATLTVSQQTFTPGTAPVSGYEAAYYLRLAQSVAGTGTTYTNLDHNIEDVRTLSGQTVTWSFWAKAAASTTVSTTFVQAYGSGGSGDFYTSGTSATLTTSWQRFTTTVTLPSVSGKTIGTGSYLGIQFGLPKNTTFTIDIWGVQLEAGSVATPFRRNAPSLQGELAACQRYYVRFSGTSSYNNIGLASALNSTTGGANFQFPVQMRTTPTSLDSGGTLYTSQYIGVSQTITAISYRSDSSPYQGVANFSVSSGLNTSYRYDFVTANTGSGNYVGFSAEL